MPTATDFQNNPDAITSSYVVLVSEQLGVLQPTPAAGTRQTLVTANYVLHYTLDTVAGTRTLVVAKISTGPQPGSVPLYFLPWQQNAATELTIPAGGAGPDVFMTSMLSGCAVQVHGTAANPTITHGNSRQSYDTTYSQLSAVLTQRGTGTAQQVHDLAEARANMVCTNAINNMLPAPGGAHSGVVRKSDYAGRVTAHWMDQAKNRFYATLARGERFTKFEEAKSGLFKAKTGAFVYGKRDHLNQWAFFYQAAVELEIEVANMFGWGSVTPHTMDSAVLGAPTQFFP
jgi:hypothetical protein